jgi:arsenite methyltransferase
MSTISSDKHISDPWAAWLLKNRHGGNEAQRLLSIEGLRPVRDKVIENARIVTGDTLLDVGTGDGLIGFGAMDKVGADGQVVFSDISQELLGVCKAYATESGLLDRCEFLKAGATDLSMLGNESVDVVTTRSVIIYVQDKQKAFDEFFRILKPGGRVSIFEPIGKLSSEFVPRGDYYLGYDIRPVKDLGEKIKEAHKAQHDSQSTMSDFDDRDLVRMLDKSGFDFIRMELEVTLGNAGMMSGNWEAFYNSSPNPLVPTLREQVETALTSEEQERFIAHIKPLVESNTGRTAQCHALVMAIK